VDIEAEVEEIGEDTKEEIMQMVIMKRTSSMITEAIEEVSEVTEEETEETEEEETEEPTEETEEPTEETEEAIEVTEVASEETEVGKEEWKDEREEIVVDLEKEEEALEKSMMVSTLTEVEEAVDTKVVVAAVETDKTEPKDMKMTLEVIKSTQKINVVATLLTRKLLKMLVTDRITLLKVTIIDI
jgi:hypothetical protein